MTPTHLKKEMVIKADPYKKHRPIKYKTYTTFFCGAADNYTISTTSLGLVTCKKCLDSYRKPTATKERV